MKKILTLSLLIFVSSISLSANDILILSCKHDLTEKFDFDNNVIDSTEIGSPTSLEFDTKAKTVIEGGSVNKRVYTERGNEIFWSFRAKIDDTNSNIWTGLFNRITGNYEYRYSWCIDGQCYGDSYKYYTCKKADKIF